MKTINFCKDIKLKKIVLVSQKKLGLNFKSVNINIAESATYKILYFTATFIMQKNDEFYIRAEKNIFE
ncbi:hypothetical protein KPL47_06070 [Clostridium estertheticum]|uniref:hypothetical protein n=1 Tax=Clostridium estertheticum TaxID=238834 RepID=UPI001C0C5A9F|nr:hypothetical protein [Clostridium estertheticum]MBU3175930.1 hypothetical protein [Clostridium estertheticum]